MTYANITTVIHCVSNLFGDFESDRKSFRCRGKPANIPHKKYVVKYLQIENFAFVSPLLSAIIYDFFGYYGGGSICMNDALKCTVFHL